MTTAAKPFERYGHDKPSTPLSITVYAIISALLIHYILLHAGFVGQSLTQLFWNVFVHATPARLLLWLDPVPDGSVGTAVMASRVARHNAKSEALSRILGLGQTTLLMPFKRARTMSGFGNGFSPFSVSAREGPPGLGNWDNSCYQNSVIQGFAALPALSEFLHRNINALGDKGGFETQRALKNMIEKLNDLGNYGKRLWTPDDLKSMSSWQQQDAQEYFSKVVDQIEKELGMALKGRTDNPGLKHGKIVRESLPPNRLASDLAVFESTDEPREPKHQNPLEGLLAQRVGCMRCGYSEGLSLIPFNCLTVPLPNTDSKQDVRDCLDEYTNLEPIEGVECGKCTLLKTREQLQNLWNQINDVPGVPEDDGPAVPHPLKASTEQRLEAVETALEDEDFSEHTLLKKCHITSRNRISTTKSRQAVIARAPRSLVIHVNRSLFDEMTGAQRKNYTQVQFPKTLDISEWCLGTLRDVRSGLTEETWEMDPKKSMLNLNNPNAHDARPLYELKAAIQHWGRHENGHYICYRKYPSQHHLSSKGEESELEEEASKDQWWRLSDDDVSMISEDQVLDTGGVFMLFYECSEEATPPEPAIHPSEAITEPLDKAGKSTLMDALMLIETIKTEFQDHPEVYTQLVGILHLFRNDKIDKSGATEQISKLFVGHPLIIEASDAFLQHGWPFAVELPAIDAYSRPQGDAQPELELEEPEPLDDSHTASSSAYSSRSSTPAPPDSSKPSTPSPSPSPSRARTVTSVMRTSSIPEKKFGKRGTYGDNVASLVTA